MMVSRNPDGKTDTRPSHPDQLMARSLRVCWHSPTADRWPCQICNHNGGPGIGAGHVCRCTREAGHPMTDYSGRAHGCTCGALWGEE